MKLKKTNAVFAILTCLMGLLHIGYVIYSYLLFSYNPKIMGAFAGIFMMLVLIHAVLGMLSVFLKGDGTDLTLYPRQNIGTIIQRVTAALILPILFIHINTMELMKTKAEGSPVSIIMLIVIEVLFFAIILSHIGFSFTRAFITLGFIRSTKTMEKMEKISLIVAAVIFVLASFAVTKTQIILFTM